MPIEQAVYDLLVQSEDVIDYFFIVDGDYDMYLIPSRVVAGRVAIQLRTYRKYLVGNASALLGADADHEAPGVVVPVS